jgi:inward rectifier potassium channel
MSRLHLRHRHDEPISVRLGALEFLKKGATRYDPRDPYHVAVTLSWRRFFLALLVVYFAINVVFALLYMLQPGSVANARPYSFIDAFFFSIETLATVGYGVMAPTTLYGHIVSAVEILCGMTFTAIMTGLIFVRFSRPKAKILFADAVVVSHHHGRPTLMVRVGNGRITMLSDASARLSAIVIERTREGRLYRTNHELKLARDRLPIFALTWTLMHVIDETSPLFGYTAERLRESDVRLILVVEARDHALNAHVYDIKDYSAATVLFGMRYQDAITLDAMGRANLDLTRIHLVEPDAPEERPNDVVDDAAVSETPRGPI